MVFTCGPVGAPALYRYRRATATAGPSEEDNSVEGTGNPLGEVNKARRYILGAIPAAAALTLAACGSEKSDETGMQDKIPPPSPSTPQEAIQVLV